MTCDCIERIATTDAGACLSKETFDLDAHSNSNLAVAKLHGNYGKYRYSLWRVWDRSKPLLLFVGLNPSTADGLDLDNTLRKVEKFARAWGYGGFIVGNAFALRSTQPRALLADPWKAIGPENDDHLRALSEIAGITMVAWGANLEKKGLRFRVASLRKLFPHGVHCWNVTKAGSPKHPLYELDAARPKEYRWVG